MFLVGVVVVVVVVVVFGGLRDFLASSRPHGDEGFRAGAAGRRRDGSDGESGKFRRLCGAWLLAAAQARQGCLWG